MSWVGLDPGQGEQACRTKLGLKVKPVTRHFALKTKHGWRHGSTPKIQYLKNFAVRPGGESRARLSASGRRAVCAWVCRNTAAGTAAEGCASITDLTASTGTFCASQRQRCLPPHERRRRRYSADRTTCTRRWRMPLHCTSPDDRSLHIVHAGNHRRRRERLHQRTRASKGCVRRAFFVPHANTPSFTGSHVHGYDPCWSPSADPDRRQGHRGALHRKLNFLAGFDANTGQFREYSDFHDSGIPFTFLADIPVFDSPNDGTYRIYPGGTPLDDAADSINGKALSAWRPTRHPRPWCGFKEQYAGVHASIPMPLGIARNDALMLSCRSCLTSRCPRR